jgi:hypothetical protein
MTEFSLLFLLCGSMAAGLLLRGAAVRFGRVSGAEKMGAICEAVALKLLLPLFVFEAVSSSGLTPQSMAMVMVGAATPAVCLLLAWAIARSICLEKFRVAEYRELAFLTASFGGGNRGTAVLLVLFVGVADFNEYLKAFVLVDLGNFLFLLLVTPVLLSRKIGAPRKPVASTWWRTILKSYFLTGFLLVFACAFLSMQWKGWPAWMNDTAAARKSVFSGLVFFALGVRMQPVSRRAMKALPIALLLFTLLRVCAAMGIASTLWMINAPDHLLVASLVLLAMPPSSLLPGLAATAGANPRSLSYMASFSGVCNLFYLLALLLIGLGVWLLQAPGTASA